MAGTSVAAHKRIGRADAEGGADETVEPLYEQVLPPTSDEIKAQIKKRTCFGKADAKRTLFIDAIKKRDAIVKDAELISQGMVLSWKTRLLAKEKLVKKMHTDELASCLYEK
jgi:hypothetical protein